MTPAGRQSLGRGTLQVVVAESLALPTGIAAAAYLGRTLGPDSYGILSVVLAVGAGLEWTIASLFSRATIRVVSEADDWDQVAASAFRMQAGFGLVTGAALWVAAAWIAAALGEPESVSSLRLLAFDVALVAAGSACRNILTGRGRYRERAMASAIRWLSRLCLLIPLVHVGLGIYGVVLAGLLSSAIWLVTGSLFARIPWTARGIVDGHRRLWRFAIPLFVIALSLRVLDKIGLIGLKALGGSAREAGWYAAAQNFTLAPSLFAMSFSPLLLGALTAATRSGDLSAGRPLVRHALRLLLGLIPFAAFGAGAAPEIVHLIYGRGFEPAAHLAIPLLAGAVGLAAVSVATTILTAADQATRASRQLWPVTILAVIALRLAVPRFGAMGAAVVIGIASAIGAVLMLEAVRRCWHVAPPLGTLARTTAIGAATLALALSWPAYGAWLFVKTLVFVSGITAALAISGEFDADDVRLARRLIWTDSGGAERV
ncbi:MAG: lipopolysaccharide biosynthesis protein [Vicinamibacterales bacterium]